MRVLVAACLAACLFSASSALAQIYPAKPVRVIVPSAPGGGYDFVGRLLGEKLGTELGQPFVVENRVGAGTLVGTQTAAGSAPDGYTLLVGGLANMAFNLGLHKDPRYDPVADFTPVALVGAFTYALVARKDLAQSTLREVLDFARANPGKLTIATSGIGTGQHISAVLLKRLANVDLLEIAYKGAQPAYVDLLAGRVDLFFDNTTTARPFIADGRVKPIVTSGAERDPLLPHVPTGRESGVEGLVLDSWMGLFAPARTPTAVVERLRAATLKVMGLPDTRLRFQSGGWREISMSPDETAAFVRSEAARWTGFLRQAGIQAQ
ncbi:MAG TPA: tripartite tricarboxylate transporter substrate binding protein [Burkholderiales bacterium]|jgi:tripartite-type tricarboxylate transporter receptor subunit TctC|nr:tripartite tricarboxylate transporter substrate binding protein [Burkholderiales bacterium]